MPKIALSKVKSDAQIEAEEREEAAPAANGPSGVTVKVRVLKKGHGKVFTGEHEKGTGEPLVHSHRDELELDRTIAEALEERGFVEIQEPELDRDAGDEA